MRILLVLIALSACRQVDNQAHTIAGKTMGTSYHIQFQAMPSQIAQLDLQEMIDSRLDDIESKMSTYIADSELSQFNLSQHTGPYPLSDDLYHVISHAQKVSILTEGAFDITVGALVNLWGFGPIETTQEVPTVAQIEQTKQYTGFAKLLLNSVSQELSKQDSKMYIDLSGIAKGFAVDALGVLFDKLQINDYLIEIGGEILAKGRKNQNSSWRAAIEHPASLEAREISYIVKLDNVAMATSGDYRNYFEVNNKRYSHTIDPRTAYPIDHKLALVTVIDKSVMHADAMATAFMVMGTKPALRLAQRLNMPIFMLFKSKYGFSECYTKQFQEYLVTGQKLSKMSRECF